jgi:hypothetical protein
MASNRSRTRERSAAHAAPTETPSQALKALARRAAHIQIAACVAAAAMTFTGWATAGRSAQTLGELIAFPRAAADHSDTRVARVSTDN